MLRGGTPHQPALLAALRTRREAALAALEWNAGEGAPGEGAAATAQGPELRALARLCLRARARGCADGGWLSPQATPPCMRRRSGWVQQQPARQPQRRRPQQQPRRRRQRQSSAGLGWRRRRARCKCVLALAARRSDCAPPRRSHLAQSVPRRSRDAVAAAARDAASSIQPLPTLVAAVTAVTDTTAAVSGAGAAASTVSWTDGEVWLSQARQWTQAMATLRQRHTQALAGLPELVRSHASVRHTRAALTCCGAQLPHLRTCAEAARAPGCDVAASVLANWLLALDGARDAAQQLASAHAGVQPARCVHDAVLFVRTSRGGGAGAA